MGILDSARRAGRWAFPALSKVADQADQVDEHQRALVPPPFFPQSVRSGLATGSTLQPDARRLLEFGVKGTQATATNAIADRISTLELQVDRRDRDADGNRIWMADPDDPIQDLFDWPNPFLGVDDLLWLIGYHLNHTGEAYLIKVGNQAGATRELWPVSPAAMEKRRGSSNPIEGFIFHGLAGEQSYRPDEVIWIFKPDPSTIWDGMGTLGPQVKTFDAGQFIDDTLREHFKNDARPRSFLELAKTDATLGGGGPSEGEKRAFEKWWASNYNRRTGEMRGLPAWIPQHWTLKELSGVSDFTELQSVRALMRDEILMANKVPRSILGDVVDANRAAAETNQYVFDRHAILPLTGFISRALTRGLTDGRTRRVSFVPFVSENAETRLAEEAQDLTTGVRSVNQVLGDRGRDPVDWGEFPRGSFGDVPYNPTAEPLGDDGDGEESESDLETPPEGDDDERGDQAANVRRQAPAQLGLSVQRAASYFAPDAEWSRVLQRDAQFVPAFRRGMRSVFRAQRDAIRDTIDLQTLELQRSIGGADYMRIDGLDDLFGSSDFTRLFEFWTEPVRRSAAQATAENVLAGLGVEAALSFDQAAEEILRGDGATMVQFVNQKTKTDIRAQLVKGLQDGDSLKKLGQRVNSVFEGASRSRALTIARTEILGAVQGGQLIGYEQSGVVESKRWNHSRLKNERPWHRALDKSVVAKTATFDLDGEPAAAPGVGAGGTSLSPRNRVNCRCFLTPVLEA